jgi:glutamate synthase domain-containing protein 3
VGDYTDEKKFVNSDIILMLSMLRINGSICFMMKLKLKKDKVSLLKSLMDLVLDNIENSKIYPQLEQDIAEFVTEIRSKKRVRYLKSLKRELNKMINEVTIQEKLMKDESEYEKHHLEEISRTYAERINADQ